MFAWSLLFEQYKGLLNYDKLYRLIGIFKGIESAEQIQTNESILKYLK